MSVGVYRQRFIYQQRKRLPVPLRPVVAAAATTTSVGWTRSLTPSPVRPSYKSGFARSAAESSSPGLWPDHAWCPTLGATGEVVHDVAGFLDGTLATGMDPASDWVASKFGPVIAFDGASDDITVGTGVTEAIQAASAFSITMRIFCTDSASDNALFGSWSSNFLLWRDENGGSDRYGFATKAPGTTITYGSNASAKTNQWQTVTVVYNTVANDCALWLDGVSDTVTGGSAPTITGTAQSAAIGADFSGDNSRVFNGRIAETLLHHRVLAPSEIRQLHSDPLSPFRQRRFTPTYPTAAEAAAAATTSVGWTRSLTPSPVRPSYKSGFARSAAESAYPGLWKGIIAATYSQFGTTGTSIVRDVTGNNRHQVVDAGSDIQFDGIGTYTTRLTQNVEFPTSGCTWVAKAMLYGESTEPTLFSFSGGGSQFYLRCSSSSERVQVLWDYPQSGYGNILDPTALTFNKWYVLSVTYDGSELRLYKDGELIGTDTSNMGVAIPDIYVGSKYGGGRNWNGKLQASVFYNRALPPNEIRQLARDPLAPFRQRRFTPTYPTAAEAAAEWQPYWGLHATRFAGILT